MKILLRVLDRIARTKILGRDRPYGAFFLLVGIPWYGLFTAFLIEHRRWVTMNVVELIFFYLALTSLWVGMAMIRRYYFPLLEAFKKTEPTSTLRLPEDFRTLVIGEREADTIVGLWTLVVMGAYLIDFPYIRATVGIAQGYVAYYVTLLGVLLMGAITGVGFLVALNTGRLVKNACGQCKFVIHIYDVDDIGGLSAVGTLAIGSTLTLATGTLYIPALLTSVKAVGRVHFAPIYVVIGIFSTLILLSFTYPNYVVHKRMQAIATRDLERLSRSLSSLSEKILSGTADKENLTTYDATRTYYLDYKSVRLYPFDLRIILELIPTVLLPVIWAVLQVILPRIM